MRMRTLALMLLFLSLSLSLACAPVGTKSISSNSPRSYNGSASVGDFLTITLEPSAQTLTYTNLSNQEHGTVPYQVNADGTYTLNDPDGNLIAAYEVPNYALLVQAAKAGPNHDELALITAVNRGKISVSTWANHAFDYMEFRTASGGLEVGSVSLDAQGNVSLSSYWPYGAVSEGSAFHQGGFAASSFQADPSGTFLKMADNNGTFDYVFGTGNGIFAVDSPNGVILGLKKAATKEFDPIFAGNYKAIYYQQTGASTGQNNVESGTPSLGTATLLISLSGQVTIEDEQGNILIVATLQPVADTSYLVGSGELQEPCNGLFTFRVATSNFQQDVFVAFMDRAVLFSSFKATLPWGSGNSYDYLYGVGLK